MRKILLFPLLLLLLIPASASAAPGMIDDALLRAESKSCKKAKAGAKKQCLRKAQTRANRKYKAMRAGTNGLYGYRIPQKLLPSQPGRLLWSKRLPATEGAARTDFVLYSSRAYPSGRRIAVSGTVSVPEGKAPRGGWPLLSWAHGTTGLADRCAPSRGVDGSYGGAEPLVAEWLGAGLAVLATDYEGLGTRGPHPYLVGPSEGRGVLHIAPAARSIAPVNTKKMFIAGHSQGGHAALFAGSLASQAPLGTVAYAPPSLLTVQADLIGTQPEDAYGLSGLALSILGGAQAAVPSIRPADILTDEALPLYGELERVCLGELGALAAEAGVGPRELLRPGWKDSASGAKFYAEITKAHPALPVRGPLLMLQGLQDTTVLPLFTTSLSSELGALNPGSFTYLRYSNKDTAPADGIPDDGADFLTETPSDHAGILADSLGDVAAWIDARR